VESRDIGRLSAIARTRRRPAADPRLHGSRKEPESGLLRRNMQRQASLPHPRYSPQSVAAPAKDPLMSLRLALCLLLVCASFPLMARDMRQMSANGDGGGASAPCADSAQHTEDSPSPKGDAKPARTSKPGKARITTTRSGDAIGETHPPRWHSFLPGMFR
jgi:hypothetical protein